MSSSIQIRSAVPEDAEAIHALICELADYERLRDQVVSTADSLRTHLFGPQPAAEAIVAANESQLVGFALFFHNYSTFRGAPGIYLEDLYVKPEFRGHGLGKQLLLHVAGLAVARGCGRMEWAVLDWNEPAIGFYRSLGADVLPDWRLCRLTGETLAKAGGTTTS